MKEQSTEATMESRPEWDTLEGFARQQIQQWLQQLLEEEVTELLGREKSVRRSPVDGPVGYRNGYGKLRRVTLSSGTVRIRRPRVRGLSERFESRILPLFKRRTEEVGRLLPELYLHGLAEGDFDLALRGLLGEGAPLSASAVARLKAVWQAEYEAWRTRSLRELEPVYLWVDGIYVKAGLEKEKAAMLVAVAGLRDGRKVVLAVESGARESTASWSAILRDLKQRGLRSPRLVVGDGHLGIWGALANVFPEAAEQRCWNHRIVNVLDKLPRKVQGTAKLLLTRLPYAETRTKAERRKGEFIRWCEKRGLDDAARVLENDWERMVTFYAFPKAHWKHLRTSNPVESPFAAVRLRTTAAKRYKKVDRATAVIWKTLLIAEQTFRRLDAPELLGEVAEGATYVDGVRVTEHETEAAA
jgi:putative transposase